MCIRDSQIVFLRKLERGGTEHSFGIHVARMAGMPMSVVSRADEIPVSYTHLDVYKRQVLTPLRIFLNARCRNGVLKLSFQHLSQPVEPLGQQFPRAGDVPVSYTHLDVYKRQPWH